jgi:hypothetical protein
VRNALTLVALCALGLFASVAAAQAAPATNTTVSYAYSGFVPCANGGAGELLTGTIDAHILETSTSTDFQARGSLVGSVTGDTYRLEATEHVTDVTNANDRGSLTYVNRYRLIGPGPGNNLVVRETAHITRSGDDYVVDRDEWSIDCS